MTFPPKSVVLPEEITTKRGDGGKGQRGEVGPGSGKEKAPRDGGAGVNGVEQTKGTGWLKARPVTLVAGSPMDRNAT